MILTFCGHNNTLLQVTNATEYEMKAIMAAVTATVNRFIAKRKKSTGWNGEISTYWYIDGYFYIPAACWKRVWDLREPDPQTYRPAYDVEFRNQDNFFNKSVTYEEIEAFVQSMNPAYDDVTDQITALWTIIVYRMSSHNIATGFGKTYLSYLLAQYTDKVREGKTLMIVPRVALVEQGIGDMHQYMQTIEPSERLNCYGICSGFRNYCDWNSANLYIGTYQSICEMPDDLFKDIKTVIADEGHTVKALSVKDCIAKCTEATIITAISGTLQYAGGADALTIEQFCGPMILNYPAHQQIERGRLPKVAVQPVILHHNSGELAYRTLLEQHRLPVIKDMRTVPTEQASTYRSVEMQFMWTAENLYNYILLLCKAITDKGKNVLVMFKNRQPAINMFELANQRGSKCHLILGGTPRDVREGIKQQLENETGWILSATDGCLSMGWSVNNLHGLVICMTGHSPHVVLQSVGRMLRKHPDKFDVTVVYDVVNDFSKIGTHFDLSNYEKRMAYYHAEQYPTYTAQHRNLDDYATAKLFPTASSTN